jgi:hypothetical protein
MSGKTKKPKWKKRPKWQHEYFKNTTPEQRQAAWEAKQEYKAVVGPKTTEAEADAIDEYIRAAREKLGEA